MIIVVVLAALAWFDLLLAGFRAAAGRDGSIDKRAYFRGALARAAGFGLVLVGFNAAVVAALVLTSSAPDGVWLELLRAGEVCIWVFGTFATLTLAALAFWLSPNSESQLLASIIVLGPLTLARPLVILGGLAFAAVRSAEPRVWIAAAVAAITMLGAERILGRSHATRWRQLC
jgi:hypothetical protein